MSLRSNCIVQALRLYRMVRRAQRAQGRAGPGHEIYVWARASRAENGVLHSGIGWLDHNTDQMELLSFKPKKPRDVPWWRAWTRLFFEGDYARGDYPATVFPQTEVLR